MATTIVVPLTLHFVYIVACVCRAVDDSELSGLGGHFRCRLSVRLADSCLLSTTLLGLCPVYGLPSRLKITNLINVTTIQATLA